MARNQWQQWVQSPFYEKLHRALSGDANDLLATGILSRFPIAREGRILIAGSGDGTSARLLSAAGYDVTGTDFSAALIDHALEFQNDTLHFYQHDLRLPFWSNYFSMAFLSSYNFGFFDTAREHDNVIRTIAGGLLPGAYLVIDYINPPYLYKHPLGDEELVIGDTHYYIMRSAGGSEFNIRITVADPSLNEPEVYELKQAKFSAGYLVDRLEKQGLEVLDRFADEELNPYRESSAARMILVARKWEASPADKEKRLYSDGRTADALT